MQIIPKNDIYSHIESKNCLCLPKIEKINTATIITHNSFDRREEIEEYTKSDGWVVYYEK